MAKFVLPYSSCCCQRLYYLVLVSQQPARVALEMCFQVTLRDMALSKRQGGLSFVLTEKWTETPLVPPRITVAFCAPHKKQGGDLTNTTESVGSFPPFCFLTEFPAHFISRLVKETFGRRGCTFNYAVQTTSTIASNIKHFFFLTFTRANLATGVGCIKDPVFFAFLSSVHGVFILQMSIFFYFLFVFF